MSGHLQRDLDSLKKHVRHMGSVVETAIDQSITSLEKRDAELANVVRTGDDEIDRLEVELEEECLKVLALHQPVATDLRFVVSVMKVNNDLERMGDHAKSISSRARYLSTHDPIEAPFDFSRMLIAVREMVHSSLNSLIDLDVDVARAVLVRDDEVDEVHASMFRAVEDIVGKQPDTLRRAIHLLSASRSLERIADLATNIAEDVIFLVSGDVVRHQDDYFSDREDSNS
ncbi:MAG: phosphate transport system protein [Planctomycetota bacterium]|jgi:phosphate transport system protein